MRAAEMLSARTRARSARRSTRVLSSRWRSSARTFHAYASAASPRSPVTELPFIPKLPPFRVPQHAGHHQATPRPPVARTMRHPLPIAV